MHWSCLVFKMETSIHAFPHWKQLKISVHAKLDGNMATLQENKLNADMALVSWFPDDKSIHMILPGSPYIYIQMHWIIFINKQHYAVYHLDKCYKHCLQFLFFVAILSCFYILYRGIGLCSGFWCAACVIKECQKSWERLGNISALWVQMALLRKPRP